MNEKIRFVLVGVVNTVTDFSILFILASVFGVATIIANVISTSIALSVSYLLNKKTVFKNSDTHNYRQAILFVVVTLSGLWIIQGIIIWVTIGIFSSLHLHDKEALFGAKLVATVFSLIWNYLWYSRVVFRQEKTSEK
jgi:putative flippase GtrA